MADAWSSTEGVLMEWEKGKFVLTDESNRIDVTRTYDLLQSTYWGVCQRRLKTDPGGSVLLRC